MWKSLLVITCAMSMSCTTLKFGKQDCQKVVDKFYSKAPEGSLLANTVCQPGMCMFRYIGPSGQINGVLIKLPQLNIITDICVDIIDSGQCTTDGQVYNYQQMRSCSNPPPKAEDTI